MLVILVVGGRSKEAMSVVGHSLVEGDSVSDSASE